jgi:hypothetical protein
MISCTVNTLIYVLTVWSKVSVAYSFTFFMIGFYGSAVYKLYKESKPYRALNDIPSKESDFYLAPGTQNTFDNA